jgi:hypothetical protein
MKARQIVVEVIYMILILNFFYEGIYKIAYWSSFSIWLHHAPLLKPIWVILTYAIPLGEIILALSLISPTYRLTALYISIPVLIVFILWIMGVFLFTHRLFWPYHALWKKPTWMEKMMISLGFCWLAFIAIVFSKDQHIKTSLRKMAANAH